ncbi:hypothetical protein ACJJTC_005714 [Scirpophaga incertulas]
MRVIVTFLCFVHVAFGSRVIFVENAPTCFRRVLAGRRALRSFVRRVVPCERLEDCRQECALERRFSCESFNYRLDPSFRGKGLCELMTRPIESFDLRRDFVGDKDYDFYEVDRNSLEPHCPETLRGPGFLHSGFLSNKPERLPLYQGSWSDRIDYYDISHSHRNQYYDDGRTNRRRYDDRSFVPYQIGVARSDDGQADLENWGVYGGYYGGYDTYYKDRNDYHKSINHWRIPNDLDRPVGVRPGHNRDFDYHSLGKERLPDNHRYGYGAWKRGRWNNSGSWGGSNYGESNYHKPEPQYYEPTDEDEFTYKDCSSRRRPGMSLGSGAIRRSLLARNVVDCEAACFGEREFKCVSYSYKYSSSHGTDNCFLSERPYRGLQLSADSGSDVYAMPLAQGCSTVNHRPWVESECFWHVRSGAAVRGAVARAALTVAGLGACEAECIRAAGFFCRGFSFRFDAPTIGDDLENCILTSSPPTSLELGHGLRSLAGHELYARGNYGRGCEPALYDDVHYREKQCYLQYDNAAKLLGAAIRGQARTRDEQACGQACNDAPFRCLSFSFNNNAPPDVDNCLLSEIRLFDLQRGVDYEHSPDDWLFAFDLFNGQCWRKAHGKTDYDEPSYELPRPISGPSDESYPASGPSGHGFGPSAGPVLPESGPSGPSGPTGPSYRPSYPERPVYTPSILDRPSYPKEPSSHGYLPKPDRPSYSDHGFRPSIPSGPDSGFKPGYRPETESKRRLVLNLAESKRRLVLNLAESKRRLVLNLAESKRRLVLNFHGDRYKPDYRPDRPGYLPESGYRPIDRPYPERPIDRPYPERPINRPYPERPINRPYPERPHADRPHHHADREEPVTSSWRHYTVSGFPCRAGTTCAQNHVAGHWACEPEGGEIGSWDYCCTPTHRCGYSEGFHKPWCYVGPSEDQWRPCSEKYYPYHQHDVPHPSQGHRDDHHHHSKPHHPNYDPDRVDRPIRPYPSGGDRKYWEDLYRDGPQAYYDRYGNPLPGYSRVSISTRPRVRYRQNYQRPHSGEWIPLNPSQEDPTSGSLGVPRYWPVAYLHKGPPPNMTHFIYNETKTTTTEQYPRTTTFPPRDHTRPEFHRITDRPTDIAEARNHRDEKTRNITEDIFMIDLDKVMTTTTTKPPEIKPIIGEEVKNNTKPNKTDVETIEPEKVKLVKDNIKGIDDKIDDFTGPIEVLDIEDVKKGEKLSDVKTLEAEEKQIEAIGRLLASRRGSKLFLEKRSQKDLQAKSISVDKDYVDFNFGNKFPTNERRGVVQKVTKDEIERERNADRSLEVSETTFIRPPRVLSTTENVRKAIINGKVFYDATIREQRDLFPNNTRRPKSVRQLEDSRALSVIANNNFGKKKVIKTRNVNPVRRVRRVYRKRYNPEEVRRRLLERERAMKMEKTDSARKL